MCDHSNESYQAVISCAFIDFVDIVVNESVNCRSGKKQCLGIHLVPDTNVFY